MDKDTEQRAGEKTASEKVDLKISDVVWPTAEEMEKQYRINAERKAYKKSKGKHGWRSNNTSGQ